jgi:hypothetical protein
MRIFGGHRRYGGAGVAEVAQTGLLFLSNHERYRGGCPRRLGIHEAVHIEKLCPVKIVGHILLASGLSYCGSSLTWRARAEQTGQPRNSMWT